MENILKIKNLKTQFTIGDKKGLAVDSFDIYLKKGTIHGIVGESGSGKTVTALSILRLLPENGEIISGEIEFKGKDILSILEEDMRKIRGNEIAMIFQEPMTSLNPVLSIGEQIIEAIVLHQKISKKQARIKACDILKKVGITEAEGRLNDYPHNFSGGMRQRVMTAMALSCNPDLLIADEPTTALDVTIQLQILELLVELSKKEGRTLLFITHDLGVVAEICDRVTVMYCGKVMEECSVEELFENPLHPYTIGLLKSVPRIDMDKNEKLYNISGNIDNIFTKHSGCPFASRCEIADEKCKEIVPQLKEIKKGHYARCFKV
ncbi:MAG: ABC transporter ATP-binding protein [Candidatus Muirbacterium halophilum]|nr:ABC transporter ATP-binding protein [Candidatus Muirbacterium halophilum]MCK9474898.1 ABC transporter ATP-binding protein [Candidatus Muirbacterium halophilum]